MKKIGVFTIDPCIYNYGGLLQEYALFSSLVSSGYETEIINYDVTSELNTFSYKRNLFYLTPKKILHRIKMKLSRGILDDTTLDSKSCSLFDDFRNEYLSFSKKYMSNDIGTSSEAYDAFVCGSDQIWNPDFNIPSYFLNFVQDDKSKVIYAASIGVPDLTRVQRHVYKKLLKKLDWISVREHEAQTLIQSLSEKKVELVLDPTLLLSKEEWKELIREEDNQEKFEPYIFCYFLGANEEKICAVKEFAQKNNLKVISVPFKNNIFVKEFQTLQNGIGPKEFLDLINRAAYIVTDSFHACVFSIIFDKQFRVFTRKAGNTNMNGRICTLLKYIQKSDFLIEPKELSKIKIEENCSYDKRQIEELRRQSLQWLKRAIEKNEN